MKKIEKIRKRIRELDSAICLGEILEEADSIGILATLDKTPPACPNCQGDMAKYDFQRTNRSPLGQIDGKGLFLYLRKRRYKCKSCKKVVVSTTPLMQKTTQISIILMEEIKALADQGYSIKKITDLLPVSSTTVIRVLK